jgi:hypothetical protein
MTKYPHIFEALGAPYHPDDLQTQKDEVTGREFTSASTVAIQNRFDEILGPENWDTASTVNATGVTKVITITLPDGKKKSASGAAGYNKLADGGDPGDPVGRAASIAFSRAATEIAPGRYLYDKGMPNLRTDHTGQPNRMGIDSGSGIDVQRPDQGRQQQQPTQNQNPSRNGYGQAGNGNGYQQEYNRQRPQTSGNSGGGYQQQNGNSRGNGQGRSNLDGQPPKNARQLFRWAKGLEENNPGVEVMKFITDWGKRNNIVDGQGKLLKMVDWPDQAAVDVGSDVMQNLFSHNHN